MTRARRLTGWQLITLAAISVIVIFLVYPMLGMVANGFRAEDGTFTLFGYRALLFTGRVHILLNTLILGVSVTFFSIILAGVLAFLITRYRFRFSLFIAFIPIATFIIPDVVVAQSWILVLGNNGILTKVLAQFGLHLPSLYSWPGLIFVMVLQNYPYAYATLLVALKGMDRSLEEAALSLGHRPWETVRRVTIPLLTPGLFAAVLLVFTHVINSFGIPAILGFRIPVMSVAIYNEFLNEQGGNPILQSSMATMLVVAGILLLWLQKHYVEGRNYQMAGARRVGRQPLGPWAGTLTAAFSIAFIAVSVVPIGAVLVSAFTETSGPNLIYGSFTLSNFSDIFLRTAKEALSNTLYLSTIATLLSTAFAVISAYCIVKRRGRLGSLLDTLLTIPLTVAGTVLGIVLANRFNAGPVVLTGGSAILILAYFLRRMPYGVRSATASLYNLSDSVEEAAISLGMRPLAAFFKVIVPVVRPAVISAGILIWVTTLSELSATLILYSSGLTTLPVAIFQQIDSNRIAHASAYSVLLLAIVAVPLIISRLLGIKVLNTK